MVKVPGDDPVELSLSILAAFDGCSTHIGRRVSVQPLFAEHRKKGGEECDSQTCVQDGLDLDYHTRRVDQCLGGWEGGSTFEGGVVDLVDENAEKRSGLHTRVGLELGLELRLDVKDECRSHRGEQTGLRPS